MAHRFFKFSLKQAQALLPRRKSSDNKSTGGRSLLIAGSPGMYGAAVLAATAAARVGSGYVTLLTSSKKFPSGKYPDFLLKNLDSISRAQFKNCTLGIGPGLGMSAIAIKSLKKTFKIAPENVVIDADALNLCAKYKLTPLPKSWVATPHEGELARLIGISATRIRADRRVAVIIAQKKLKCVVVLKGHKTLVADETHLYEIQSGNAALAKAGTGDVLTGMITGFRAQGLSALHAACLGIYVHGWMADEWIKEKHDPLSLLATDLLNALPRALAQIRKRRTR